MQQSNAVSCLCGAFVCSTSQVAFFEQNPDAWHLVVRPEDRAAVESGIDLFPHPKVKSRKFSPHKFACLSCNVELGNDSRVGPTDSPMLCFQFQKVQLSSCPPCVKWSSARLLVPHIEQRPLRKVEAISSNPYSNSANWSYPSVRRANMGDVHSTDVRGLLPGGKIPRSYQLELFVEAVRGDSIVFLPTGSGKTLVAAMVVHRMLQLNPGRCAVFLADRIPLVHQQACVMREEAGLRVQVRGSIVLCLL